MTSVVFTEADGETRAFFKARAPRDWALRWIDGPLAAALETLSDCEVLSVFVHTPVTAATVDGLPRLKLIVTRSTGFDHVDLAACRARDVTVCNVPEYASQSVAEHTIALLLAVARRLLPAQARTRQGKFDIAGLRGVELAGKTVGVVGTGHIGACTARLARGFGMRVVATDPVPNPALARDGVAYLALPELCAQSDVISLHCPSIPSTRHLLNADMFARMKRGAILINTARGDVVDTAALVQSLERGIVAGAGLDVLEEETCLHFPPCATDSEAVRLNARLLERDDVVITPHIAFDTDEALARLRETTFANIEAFLQRRPQNRVDESLLT